MNLTTPPPTSTLTPSDLLERNRRSIGDHQPRGLAPDHPVIVVTCVDARTDPAHVFDLEPGACLVYRNAGGRITDDTERELVLLTTMMKAAGGPEPIIVVMHHEDCGLQRLADPAVRGFITTASGLDESDVEIRSISDPVASVVADVERLATHPALTDASVHAFLFDVETGVASEVG